MPSRPRNPHPKSRKPGSARTKWTPRRDALEIFPYFYEWLMGTFGDQMEAKIEELYDKWVGIKSDPISNDEAMWIEEVVEECLDLLDAGHNF